MTKTRTGPLRWLLALLVPFAFIVAACGDDDGDTDAGGTTTTEGDGAADAACSSADAPGDDVPTVTIGAQDFGESAILAEIYGQCLEAAGYDVAQQDLGGFRDLEIAAFDSGDINFGPEYVASMLEFLNEFSGEATADVDETLGLLQERLDPLGLLALEPSDAVDTNAFVVTQETADELGLVTISDLADHAADLTLGAVADCETNAFCLPGLETVYGIDLSAGYTALESGAIPDALDAGEIDVAVLFSTDAIIAENGWVLLEDDQNMLAADNVVPVITTALADAGGDALVELLNAVSAALTTDGLTELNRQFSIDREDADAIAADFLAEAGLV